MGWEMQGVGSRCHMKGRAGAHSPQLWVRIVLSLTTAKSVFSWIFFLLNPGLTGDLKGLRVFNSIHYPEALTSKIFNQYPFENQMKALVLLPIKMHIVHNIAYILKFIYEFHDKTHTP